MERGIASASPRFWKYVNKDGPVHPAVGRCRVWTGNNWYGNGYCQFDVSRGVRMAVHKFSWVIHFGDYDRRLLICHACDNVRCVNPDHLFLGTNQDNMDDKVSKDRQSRLKGMSNGMAKLTDGAVRYIRRVHVSRHHLYSKTALARKFGVTITAVGFVLAGETWKHVQ